ncbi:MAG TPA: hypothetical protein DC047_16695, partial [Blastocatellia bacterium]|nr:hypothetical protein [Blastocatellia bacterium]
MPRILHRYSYAQLVLVLSLLLLLTSFPLAQTRLVRTLSSSIPSARGISFAEHKTNVAQLDYSQSVVPAVSTKQSARADLTTSSAKAKEAYGVMPLSFEANSGPTNRKVKFLARGQGYGLFLTATGPVISLTKNSAKKTASGTSLIAEENEPSTDIAVVSWEMVSANKSPRISGVDALPGKANYFRGNDPSQWRTNVPTYARVRYSNVYPGIDVIYYGNQRQLEYDFIVAPGKDPNRIKLSFKGADAALDAQGNLVLRTPAGDITQAKPFAYQEIAGVRREVSARYRAVKGVVSLSLANYDRTVPLVIDPVLVYSSFLGGINGEEGRGIAVDSQGNAYITGKTFSSDFPVVGAFQGTKGSSGSDAFVVKVNPSGNALIYSTYLGGNGSETPAGIKVDDAGNAYVAGTTFSTNFPTTVASVQPTKDKLADGFITKLNSSGSSLIYSTFLGGDDDDSILGLALSADGRVSVTGNSYSSRFAASVFPAPRGDGSANKTINRAANWSVSANGLTASVVNSFAIQPGNSNIIYAATNTGIFKTIDGGANWTPAGLGNPATTPPASSSVVIDPLGTSIVYAGTENGVYQSTDAGTTFQRKSNGLFTEPIESLAIDAVDSSTLYAGTFSGLFKTVTGANTWTEVVYGSLVTPAPVMKVVVDPTNHTVVYVGTLTSGLYKTTSGNGWVSLNSGAVMNNGQVTALAVDPVNSSVVYAAFFDVPNLFKTTNGGASWTSLNLSYTLDGQSGQFAEITALTVDPVTTNTVYAGTFGGGVFKSTDAGANWSQSNTGLTQPYVTGLALDSANPAVLFAGLARDGDSFVARVNSGGSSVDYVRNFGGDRDESAQAIAVDTDGSAYVAGETASSNFPTVNALQSTPTKLGDAFVAKFNNSGNFVYSTFLGGNSGEFAYAIAVRDGNAFVVGQTGSTDFPTVNAFKSVLSQNDADAFVAKLNSSGTALDFSTYLGGSSSDKALGVAVDAPGNIYVTGSTASLNFPVLAAPQNFFFGGGLDAFVTEFNPSGSQLIYSTFLGGTASDQANAIAVGAAGDTYITGVTSSFDFPTVNAFQSVRRGNDAFFAKIGAATPVGSVQFAQADYSTPEEGGGVTVEVTRTGLTSTEMSINYATFDSSTGNCNQITGNASSKCDYETMVGTLHFAPGETSKTIYIPLINDSYLEGNEIFRVLLSGVVGGVLGTPSTANITITSSDTANGPNPIDQANFFVRQHYIDFLNREPDASG